MNMKVTKLSDLGTLLLRNADPGLANATDRAGIPLTDPAPQGDTVVSILRKAMVDAAGFSESSEGMRKVLHQAISSAYTLGTVQAKNEHAAIHEAAQQTYESRQAFTLPAAVAAIMDQTGMTELTLDMHAVASVFTRCSIDYRLCTGVDGRNDVHYKLSYFADQAKTA